MNARFSLLTITHLDADGVDRQYTLIVDNNSRKQLDKEGDFGGPFEEAEGFLRCRGQQYVATYGRETPVMRGSDDEIYYQPWYCFDGLWNSRQADRRGIHHYVKATSGEGKLFAALEKFANESGLEAVA